MRVLVVDDSEERQVWFAREWKGHEVVAAVSALEATRALEGDRFDVVTLDYDLGDCSPCGSVVAHFIAHDLPPEKRPGQIILHSANPIGARDMATRLHDAGIESQIQPFRF